MPAGTSAAALYRISRMKRAEIRVDHLLLLPGSHRDRSFGSEYIEALFDHAVTEPIDSSLSATFTNWSTSPTENMTSELAITTWS